MTGSEDLSHFMIEEHNFFNGVEPLNPDNPYENFTDNDQQPNYERVKYQLSFN